MTPDPTAQARAREVMVDIIRRACLNLQPIQGDIILNAITAALLQAYEKGVADERSRQNDPLGH